MTLTPTRQDRRPARPVPLVVGYVLKMFPRFSETFILNEILELERRGVEVVVFSMKEPNESTRQPRVGSVHAKVHVIPPLSPRAFWTHAFSHLSCFLRNPVGYLDTMTFALGRRSASGLRKFLMTPYIVRQARLRGVQHFHAHFASGPARQAKFASLLSGIPFSFTAHAKDLYWEGHQHGRNKKLKKRVRWSSFVITISEYNRRFIEQLGFKLPRNRVVTLYNGLDLEHWPFSRADGLPLPEHQSGPPLVLAVGRLVKKKGFHRLIEACRMLRDDGVPFRCLVVGEGPEEQNLRMLIEEHDLNEIVQLPGPAGQDRLAGTLFPAAHLLVQPSVIAADGDRDGIPTVVLEAMATGLPVVTTPVSGIGEAVVDGRTGLLSPPDDVPGLAAAIRRILEDPDLARRLSIGARNRVETRFDLRQNAKVLIHLFEVSAHRQKRWSNRKLRQKVGLDLAEPMAEG